MVPARVKKTATTPSIAPTVVMRIACEARFVDKEAWNRVHKKPAVYARKWAEQVVGLQHRKCVHDAFNFTERKLAIAGPYWPAEG